LSHCCTCIVFAFSILAIPPTATYCLRCCITTRIYAHFPNWSSTAPDSPIYERFDPFQPSAIRSNPPCQPSSLVGTSQVNPSTIGSNLPCQLPSVVGTSQVNPSTRSVLLQNQSHSATVKVIRGATQ